MSGRVTELLPCPWCASADDIQKMTHSSRSFHLMVCMSCGAEGPAPGEGQSAEDCWNTRAAPHMREGEAVGTIVPRFSGHSVVMLFNSDLPVGTKLYTAPPKADAVDLPPGMMLIQKSDAECLVHDHERYAVGHTASTVGGRLAARRVRELLSLDSSRSKP